MFSEVFINDTILDRWFTQTAIAPGFEYRQHSAWIDIISNLKALVLIYSTTSRNVWSIQCSLLECGTTELKRRASWLRLRKIRKKATILRFS